MTASSAFDRATVQTGPVWRQRARQVEVLVLVAGVAVLVVLAVGSVTPTGRDRLQLAASWSVGLLAAALVYALGHLLRALRLAVLVHDPVVGARQILAVHLFSAGTGLLLPFRLGDVVRIRATAVLVGSTTRGVVAVVVERLLDVAVVLGLTLVAAGAAGGSLRALAPLLALSTVFVLLAAAALTVMPAYLRALSLYIVRRPDAPGGERLLTVLERALLVVDQAPQLVRRRTSTLVLLTALVWIAELSALGLAVPALGQDPVRLSQGLLSFLSSLSSGSIALLPEPGQSPLYRAVLLVPLLWASAVCGVLIARRLLPRLARERRPSW